MIRLKVERLSKDREAPPVWLWSSKTGVTPDDVDRFWQAFLRRFDLEHTFRFAKQTLGWTTPKLRSPEAADRWTWILIVAHTQLRLARPLAKGLRRPWEKPTASARLTPARVRRGFRNIRAHLACPARDSVGDLGVSRYGSVINGHARGCSKGPCDCRGARCPSVPVPVSKSRL